ncbi:hypothetical protein [Rhodococcus sp. HNM0569]|uniref:hypothetical protein n=1 Tax=Rhodococcus sp. HNM0569 TaxID=2716340 RepID=UPI00146B5A9C|nr:hypothetical protein [Rhodococcus sp. HNM0569]NLU83704.1 hypothetical protein [Rhodococcus sp. HNM0569]
MTGPLSPMDDLPIHQVAEPVRRVATSDRNFYDRYYFNCYPLPASGDDPEFFLVVGMGQYPNLGVTDAFAVLRRGDDHVVARASAALGADRSATTVGPFRIEILEGLQRLRVVLAPDDALGLSVDLTFDGNVPATLEPRHFRRELERVTFDTMRFVQTGTWTGTVTLDGTSLDAQSLRGNRDRSWGVRPVGEAEPPGRRAAGGPANFFWIYSVMQFDDFTVSVVLQEDEQGRRLVEEAVRIPRDGGEPEWLGRPEHRLEFAPGTRDVTGASLSFHRPTGETVTVDVALVLPNYIGIGTGYGLEADWRHGMWQGPLVVQEVRRAVADIDATLRMFCPVDNMARFTLRDGDDTFGGTGLFEVAAIGPHAPSGFESFTDTAP